MSAASSASPAGTPSTSAVRRGPCDSPAVIQRKRDIGAHASLGIVAEEVVKLSATSEGAVRFEVHARPRARATAIDGVRAGALLVRLAAAPVDGAANEELVAALATALGVPKRAIAVVRGASSRSKLVEVRGLSPDEVRVRLAAARAS